MQECGRSSCHRQAYFQVHITFEDGLERTIPICDSHLSQDLGMAEPDLPATIEVKRLVSWTDIVGLGVSADDVIDLAAQMGDSLADFIQDCSRSLYGAERVEDWDHLAEQVRKESENGKDIPIG